MDTFHYPETGKAEFPCIYYDQFDLVCKYIGLGPGDAYCVPSYYHFILKGPRHDEIRATALELKIRDPRLEYENAASYLNKKRYFVLGGNLDTWTEITKGEYIALRILERMDYHTIKKIEYEPELQKITAIRACGSIVTDCAYDIDEFLKVVDAMNEIRSGDFYARIKEAKHE